MIRFVIRRMLAAIPIGLVVTLGVFALVFAMPGDPIRELAGDKPIPPSVLAAKRAQFHLDEPFLVQYGLYMKDMAVGDFGETFDGQDIGQQLRLRVPVTLKLAMLANAFQWVIALLFGTYAGFKRNGAADRLLMASTLFVLAVPLLVLAFTAQFVFGVQLKWLPVSSVAAGFPVSFLLPALALAVVGFAGVARVLRTSVVECVNSDFVKTARAKGLGEQRVLWRHILPNAMLPVLTLAGFELAGIFAGAVLTESIFNLPGLGQFLFQAIRLKEGGVVVLLSMIAFVSFVLVNLVVDILYGVVDPRVRHG
jgi:ABC-type dipeptide/oligopeptide/nickel transport system permease component